VSDEVQRPVVPKGGQIRSGTPAALPVKLLHALGVLFEELGCVSEAYIVLVQFVRPDSGIEPPPHFALEIRMSDGSHYLFPHILSKIQETIGTSFPYNPNSPVDIVEIGKDSTVKEPLNGSQLFCKFVDGKAVPM